MLFLTSLTTNASTRSYCKTYFRSQKLFIIGYLRLEKSITLNIATFDSLFLSIRLSLLLNLSGEREKTLPLFLSLYLFEFFHIQLSLDVCMYKCFLLSISIIKFFNITFHTFFFSNRTFTSKRDKLDDNGHKIANLWWCTR